MWLERLRKYPGVVRLINAVWEWRDRQDNPPRWILWQADAVRRFIQSGKVQPCLLLERTFSGEVGEVAVWRIEAGTVRAWLVHYRLLGVARVQEREPQ